MTTLIRSHAHPLRVKNGAASRKNTTTTGTRRRSAAAHGHPHAETSTSKSRPGERKGFVEEMRFVAMKLHTKEQAPKEGEKEEPKTPMSQWQISKETFLQFLVDSKVVYDTMESIVASESHPSYTTLINTGLERSGPLEKDIQYFATECGLEAPSPGEAGSEYSKYLVSLAETNVPAFICHFYNVYFAHSAGGRMIGKMAQDKCLDGHELAFYQWEGDLKEELLPSVRSKIDEIAEDWSREEKDKCLEETELSFKYSGSILRVLAGI